MPTFPVEELLFLNYGHLKMRMRYRLLHFLFLLLLFPFTRLSAQAPAKGSVHGQIGDENGNPLPYATVLVMKATDSVQVNGVHTAQDGKFSIAGLPAGRYRLKVTYLGYTPLDTAFVIRKDRLQWKTSLYLQPAAHALQSVEVTATRPATEVHGDTVAFNPGAYKMEPDETAEDLVKKIPALEMDDNGNIQTQGKPITKVLVDGKPFFEGNSTDALKMLPASILDKIEVLNDPDQEYDASDPEKPRVLNLVIKKDKKRGYYANVRANAGNRGQFDGTAKGNLIRGEEMLALRGDGSKGAQSGHNYRASPFYRNYVNDKFSYRLGLRYSRAEHENYGNSRQENFFGDTSYFVNQSNSNMGRNDKYSASGGFDYKPDSTMRIRFWQSFDLGKSSSGSYNQYTNSDESDTTLARGSTQNSSHSRNPGMSSNLNFIYRFKKPGRHIETNLSYNRGGGDNTSTVYALRNDLKQQHIDTTDQTKIQHTENRGLNFRINYITPFLFEKSSLNVGYNVSLNNNLNNYDSYNNEISGKVFDSLLSNEYRNHDYNHNVSLDYSFHPNAFRYHMGIAYQRILTRGINFLHDSTYTTSRYSLYPRGGLRYDFDEHNDISLNYNGSLQPPTFEQLQPTINNIDPQHIRIGNPSLKPQFSSSFRLKYDRYSPRTMNTLNIRLNYNLSKNQIQNINTFDTATGVITTQPENVPSNYEMDGRVDYVFFVNQKSSISLHSNATYNSFIQRYNAVDYSSTIDANTGNIIINQEMDGNLRLGGGIKFYLTFFDDVLIFSGGSNVDFSTFTSNVEIKGGLAVPVGQQYYNMHNDFDTELELPWDMKYGIYFNYSKQSNISDADLNGYNLVVVNSALTKRLFDKKGALSLRVNDIGNGIAKRNALVDPEFVKDSPFANNTRFYTLSFSYTINKLGARHPRHSGDNNDSLD